MIPQSGLVSFTNQVAAASVFCPICRGSGLAHWVSDAQYTYVQCKGCGIAFLEPKPSKSDLERFYNLTFEVDRDNQAKKIEQRSDMVLKCMSHYLPQKGTLLEIGSSYGHFLRCAKGAGWDVEGVEISQTAAEWSRMKFGVSVHVGSLEDVLGKLENSYDAVVMLHVLEHYREPEQLLRDVRKLLRPQGIIIIKTPNVSSWIATVCGRTWEWLTPPAHIFLFSPHAISLILQTTGYQIRYLTTQQGDAHNTLFEILRAFLKKISRRASPDRDGTMLSRRSWFRVVENACGVSSWPFRPLENAYFVRTLAHPELFVVAEKVD